MKRHFVARTEGQNHLGLRDLCQRYCDERWFAAHMKTGQAADSLLDEFKKAVRQELELLEVECVEGKATSI
jgi:hypothetical protein